MALRQEGVVTCRCGNAARYIDLLGHLTCGICPLKNNIDSIRIADVPKLLAWARCFQRMGSAAGLSDLGEILGKEVGPGATFGIRMREVP